MDQTQTPRYVSRFEPLLYVLAFTQKDFHYIHIGSPTKGTSTEKFAITNLGVHNSSLQHNNLYSRDKAQSQNSITSTQEGWAQSQHNNHNHLHTRGMNTDPKLNQLYTRGIGTKPNHNHLYTRGISTNPK